MEQHELSASLHTPTLYCWIPLRSSLWPPGCLPSLPSSEKLEAKEILPS